MAKRFGDTEIWKRQRWFRKLNPIYKLAFCYIKDQCDHSGIWNIDCSDLIEDLGIDTFDLSDFVKLINTEYDKITGSTTNKDRIIIVHGNMLWITGFIQFQYESKEKIVPSTANAVKSALFLLDSIRINPSEPFRTLPNPSEPFSVLAYALDHLHIKSNQPLAILREGFRTLKDKDRDRDNLVKQQNEKNNGKQIVNFKTQGEELFAKRDKEHRDRLNGL